MVNSPATSRWWLAPAAGALVSATVTIIMVVWEWLENPGGIFRSDSGTNWEFVYDTAISWLLPTFGYVTAIAVAGHLLWLGVGWFRRRELELPDD